MTVLSGLNLLAKLAQIKTVVVSIIIKDADIIILEKVYGFRQRRKYYEKDNTIEF